MKKVLRLFHTQGYDTKNLYVCLVIFTLLLEKVCPKIPGDDNTWENISHFANSFKANYCKLVFDKYLYFWKLMMNFEPVLEREKSIVYALACNYRCPVTFALSPLLQTPWFLQQQFKMRNRKISLSKGITQLMVSFRMRWIKVSPQKLVRMDCHRTSSSPRRWRAVNSR